MRSVLSSTAVGLALAAAAVTAAHAQTVITPATVVTAPAAAVVAPATETVTTETVRTFRPLRPRVRQVVTTRTVSRRIVPAPTVVARTVAVAPRPLYDEVVAAPIADSPAPLYDTVAPPAVAAPAPLVASSAVIGAGAVVGAEPYTYRYVYEPDRILVIDPASGIAVQSIPR
jgi:hypothetical protein